MKNPTKKIAHCKPFAVAGLNLVSLYNNGHRPNAGKQVGTTQKLNNAFLKNTLLFLSFFILGFGSELRAQDLESIDKEVKTHNWEVGLNLRPFFDTPIKVGVMVKRSLKDKTKAIRFRTAPEFYNTNNKTFPGIGGTNFLNASFDLGIEKRKQSGRFVFYYGSDLRFIFQLDATNIGLGINQPNPSLSRNYFRYIATGISGIIGGKFFLNHRFSLSAETSLSLTYGWTRREMGTVDYNLRPINLLIEESSGALLFLNGLSVFMISYHF
ncbi:MAG: hypothetical protein U0X91_14700 [Spirosomataceae bacterium]